MSIGCPYSASTTITPTLARWFFGIIAVSLDKVREEYGWKHVTAERRKKIESYLEGEIETLDNYYTGEVFGFEITPSSDDREVLDSCRGSRGSSS